MRFRTSLYVITGDGRSEVDVVQTRRRGPGRPAHGSREKLISAACSLIAERGLEATSPTMVLKRSGVGHGSLYHYFTGKPALALAAIEEMRSRTLPILNLPTSGEDDGGAPSAVEPATVDAALDRFFTRREGRGLLRMLADPAAAESAEVSDAIVQWCYDLRASIYLALNNDDEPRTSAARLHEIADPHLTAAIGRGLLGLPREGALSGEAG